MEFSIRYNWCGVPILWFGSLQVAVLECGREVVRANFALRDALNSDDAARTAAAEVESDTSRIWSHLWALVDEQDEASPRLRALAESLTARVSRHRAEV